ncbi:MAG: alkaline phosphatase family protein [Blastocatellales bacterium]|nr:alkaline phosphatase family protein [Blastocatellales bacterium]
MIVKPDRTNIEQISNKYRISVISVFFRVFCVLWVLCCILSALCIYARSQNREKIAVPKQPPLTTRAALVIIEGFGAEQLRRLGNDLPNLKTLAARGSSPSITESVYPSLHASARATILTGMLPVDHGVFGDEPDASPKNNIETIIDLAVRSGLSVVAPAAQLEDEIIRKAAGAAANKEIDLLIVEFDSYATAVMKHGTGGRETIAAIRRIDEAIGKIVEAGGNEMTVAVVSDAGRLRTEREFRPNVILERKGFLATDKQGNITSWRARAEARGGAAAIFVQDAADEELIAEVETAFKDLIEGSESPVWGVVTRREAARLGCDPRPVLYLDAAPLYVMSDRASGSSTGRASVKVSSGYLPSRSETRPVFIVAGSGIKTNGRIEYARLTDVAPTLARLLGLEMKAARGRVLSEFLQQ